MVSRYSRRLYLLKSQFHNPDYIDDSDKEFLENLIKTYKDRTKNSDINADLLNNKYQLLFNSISDKFPLMIDTSIKKKLYRKFDLEYQNEEHQIRDIREQIVKYLQHKKGHVFSHRRVDFFLRLVVTIECDEFKKLCKDLSFHLKSPRTSKISTNGFNKQFSHKRKVDSPIIPFELRETLFLPYLRMIHPPNCIDYEKFEKLISKENMKESNKVDNIMIKNHCKTINSFNENKTIITDNHIIKDIDKVHNKVIVESSHKTIKSHLKKHSKNKKKTLYESSNTFNEKEYCKRKKSLCENDVLFLDLTTESTKVEVDNIASESSLVKPCKPKSQQPSAIILNCDTVPLNGELKKTDSITHESKNVVTDNKVKETNDNNKKEIDQKLSLSRLGKIKRKKHSRSRSKSIKEMPREDTPTDSTQSPPVNVNHNWSQSLLRDDNGPNEHVAPHSQDKVLSPINSNHPHSSNPHQTLHNCSNKVLSSPKDINGVSTKLPSNPQEIIEISDDEEQKDDVFELTITPDVRDIDQMIDFLIHRCSIRSDLHRTLLQDHQMKIELNGFLIFVNISIRLSLKRHLGESDKKIFECILISSVIVGLNCSVYINNKGINIDRLSKQDMHIALARLTTMQVVVVEAHDHNGAHSILINPDISRLISIAMYHVHLYHSTGRLSTSTEVTKPMQVS